MVEPCNAVLHPIPRRQHEDAGDVSGLRMVVPGCLDDVPADVETVRVGQVEVEADHVVVMDPEALEGRSSIPRHIDGVALPAQAGRDRPRQVLLVLDHEDPHVALLVPGPSRVTRTINAWRGRKVPGQRASHGEPDGRRLPLLERG
jgi:hypothetical protein